MNSIQRQKIDFYNACYYLCGISCDATFIKRGKIIKITDTLDAYVQRYLGYDDGLCAFNEAYFDIVFIQNEKPIWGTRINLPFRRAERLRDYFWKDCHEMDYVLSCLKKLKPSNNYFVRQPMPDLLFSEQQAVIKKSCEVITESLISFRVGSIGAKKIRKLVKNVKCNIIYN